MNKYNIYVEGSAFQENSNNSALKIGLVVKVLPVTSHNISENY